MKNFTKKHGLLLFLLGALFTFSSCEKDTTTTSEQEVTAQDETIAFAASGTIISTSSTSDSVYVMEACKKGDKKSEISFEALPDSVETYLSVNYSGYASFKAFKISDTTASTTQSFVVIIKFNDKPVALKFDANGAFVKVLELRERRDIKGKGWHLGGWFEHRNGLQKDTIAIASLDSKITLYFTATYPQDTLIHAVKNRDGSIVVLSQSSQLYATAFTSTGVFIKRITMSSFPGKASSVAQSSLSANIITYLDTTYPNYVFKKAFSVKLNGTLKGYLVFIDANLTKYVIRFDATENFVSSVAVR